LNPHDELRALCDLFPGGPPLFAQVEHIPKAVTPEPYQSLLVHDQHMTVTMERYHGTTVDVQVLAERRLGDIYARKIVLLKHGTTIPVQFGLVRFNLSYVTEPVRQEILSKSTPLGRVLIKYNVLRHVDLGAILQFTAGPGLAELLQMSAGDRTYGRLATIFCDHQPAVDLLEISAPLPQKS
jgi:chorismate-pyruvate lyase